MLLYSLVLCLYHLAFFVSFCVICNCFSTQEKCGHIAKCGVYQNGYLTLSRTFIAAAIVFGSLAIYLAILFTYFYVT